MLDVQSPAHRALAGEASRSLGRNAVPSTNQECGGLAEMPSQRSIVHVLVWTLPPLVLVAVLAFSGL